MVVMPLATAILLVSLKLISVYADVFVLDSYNKTIHSYPSESAMFGPRLSDEGVAGHVIVAVPVNACTHVSKVQPNGTIFIALIRREPCTFAKKVFNVQQAGYGAAVVYNVGSDVLVPMRGDGESSPILIPSVFVGESSGLSLSRLPFNYTIVLREEHSGHSIFFIPFTVVFPLCVLVLCFFFCVRFGLGQLKKKRSRLSKSNLKKLPVKKFKKGDKFEVCAVCLDEYEDGDKLRELPCAHAYHQKCIDPWLTKSKQTCPLCNKKVFPTDDDSDAENGNGENRSNENTPLLTARGNAMSDYGISIASRSNAQRADSESEESIEESPDEALPNRVVSTVEVHAKPAAAGPAAAARENAGFDLRENHFGAEKSVPRDSENGSTVAAATDPLVVEVRGTDLPSGGDRNRMI